MILGRRRAVSLLAAPLVTPPFAALASRGVADTFPAAMQPDMFAESAAYDRFMGRWSRQLAPLFVTFVGVADGQDVLDVGSGTGVLALAVAAAAPKARVVGIDPAAPYVAFAQKQAAGRSVRFEVGDAQQMTFADRRFDRVVSLLVMNFIPDPAKALREMTRVTRPGGTIAAAVWDYGDGMRMLRVFWDEAVALDPSIAKRDERHMPLCRSGELAALWRAQGLQQVVEQPLSFDMRFPSFDDYWQPFLGGQGPAGAYAARLAEPARAALRDRLRQRLLEGRADGPLVMPARVWAVKGVVPAP
jgi:SAM-dependent methyltransferase